MIYNDNGKELTLCWKVATGAGGDILIPQVSTQSDSIDLDRSSELSTSDTDIVTRTEIQRAKFQRQQTIFMDQDATDQVLRGLICFRRYLYF